MTITMALGKPPLPTAIKWRIPRSGKGAPPRRCCVSRDRTESCIALVSIRAVLYAQPGHVTTVHGLLDGLENEWLKVYNRWPGPLLRPSIKSWMVIGLTHAHRSEFELGRLAPTHEFVSVERGELGVLFDLDTYRKDTP